MIKEITSDHELRTSVNVIRTSFSTVAKDFDLTEENCPTSPAFMTYERLDVLKEKGAKLFGLYENVKQIGFVAVEKATDSLYYMEHLAVLPGWRHRGNGKKILDFVDDYVRQRRGRQISIGIIEENTVLKRWYESLGYVETDLKRFEHLPFTVCFLEKTLKGSPS